MFSENRKVSIENKFRQLLQEVPLLQEAADIRLTDCQAESVLAMKYLYTTMPFSAICN